MAHCEASAIFLFPIDLKLLGHLFLSISLPHAKMQPHFPSIYLIVIFQSSRKKLCEGRASYAYPNELQFCMVPHIIISYPSTKVELMSCLHVSSCSILCFCPKFQFVKQVYFILLHYGSQFF